MSYTDYEIIVATTNSAGLTQITGSWAYGLPVELPLSGTATGSNGYYSRSFSIGDTVNSIGQVKYFISSSYTGSGEGTSLVGVPNDKAVSVRAVLKLDSSSPQVDFSRIALVVRGTPDLDLQSMSEASGIDGSGPIAEGNGYLLIAKTRSNNDLNRYNAIQLAVNGKTIYWGAGYNGDDFFKNNEKFKLRMDVVPVKANKVISGSLQEIIIKDVIHIYKSIDFSDDDAGWINVCSTEIYVDAFPSEGYITPNADSRIGFIIMQKNDQQATYVPQPYVEIDEFKVFLKDI